MMLSVRSSLLSFSFLQFSPISKSFCKAPLAESTCDSASLALTF